MFNSRTSVLFSLGIAGLFLSLPAVAKERQFSPVPQAGQEVRYSDGAAVLVTGNIQGNLAVSFVPIDKKSGLLRIWAENASEQKFNISETSITGTTAAGPLVVMTYADQVKAQKRKEMWAAIATGVAAGLNSYAASNAGYSNYSGTYNSQTSATVYGSRGGYATGNAYTSGRFYGTSYNAGVAYMAQANAAMQNQAMFDRYQSIAASAAQNLRDRSLKANTLMPGQSVMGDVKIILPGTQKGLPAEIRVQVNIGGSPLDLLFREGPPVVDNTPRAAPSSAVASTALPSLEANTVQTASVGAAPVPVPAAVAYTQPAPMPVQQTPPLNSGAEMAKAYANPSGPAARSEFVKLGCMDGFALVSSSAGRSIFESTCGAGGKKQLLQCRGGGCTPLN